MENKNNTSHLTQAAPLRGAEAIYQQLRRKYAQLRAKQREAQRINALSNQVQIEPNTISNAAEERKNPLVNSNVPLLSKQSSNLALSQRTERASQINKQILDNLDREHHQVNIMPNRQNQNSKVNQTKQNLQVIQNNKSITNISSGQKFQLFSSFTNQQKLTPGISTLTNFNKNQQKQESVINIPNQTTKIESKLFSQQNNQSSQKKENRVSGLLFADDFQNNTQKPLLNFNNNIITQSSIKKDKTTDFPNKLIFNNNIPKITNQQLKNQQNNTHQSQQSQFVPQKMEIQQTKPVIQYSLNSINSHKNTFQGGIFNGKLNTIQQQKSQTQKSSFCDGKEQKKSLFQNKPFPFSNIQGGNTNLFQSKLTEVQKKPTFGQTGSYDPHQNLNSFTFKSQEPNPFAKKQPTQNQSLHQNIFTQQGQTFTQEVTQQQGFFLNKLPTKKQTSLSSVQTTTQIPPKTIFQPQVKQSIKPVIQKSTNLFATQSAPNFFSSKAQPQIQQLSSQKKSNPFRQNTLFNQAKPQNMFMQQGQPRPDNIFSSTTNTTQNMFKGKGVTTSQTNQPIPNLFGARTNRNNNIFAINTNNSTGNNTFANPFTSIFNDNKQNTSINPSQKPTGGASLFANGQEDDSGDEGDEGDEGELYQQQSSESQVKGQMKYQYHIAQHFFKADKASIKLYPSQKFIENVNITIQNLQGSTYMIVKLAVVLNYIKFVANTKVTPGVKNPLTVTVQNVIIQNSSSTLQNDRSFIIKFATKQLVDQFVEQSKKIIKNQTFQMRKNVTQTTPSS